MKESKLFKKYTVPEIMFELKKIRKIFFGEKKTMITELSKTQKEVLESFNISSPHVL